jgi:hypothetical protein
MGAIIAKPELIILKISKSLVFKAFSVKIIILFAE